MLNRKIWIAAGLIYVVVLVCVLFPSKSPAVETKLPAPELVSIKGMKPFISVTIRLQRVDWVEEYKKTIDKVVEEGADSVLLVVDSRQDSSASTRMYPDMRTTMTPPQLAEIIGHAKSRNLRVILMPIVLLDNPDDPNWRGKLFPKKIVDGGNRISKEVDGWDRWFDSYRDMITHYARIARDTNVDVFCVGSELVNSQIFEEQWIKTIHVVRQIYKGPVTYSSNWDAYDKVSFWDYLDLVSMNSYWDLSDEATPSAEDIDQHWSDIQSDVFRFVNTVHKPLLFTEIGWCSLSNAATKPWDYTQTQLSADNELQKKLYQAYFNHWWGRPELAGFSIWEFDPGGDETGKGYTPLGKPAEEVMRKYFHQPRWQIAGTE